MSGHVHAHFDAGGQKIQIRLAISIFLTLSFVIVEIIAGWVANSLALLTDAAHNFTDIAALTLTSYALYLENQPAHSKRTFGYHRVGILVALLNSTTLALIALGIFYEAYQRFLAPPVVSADILIAVSAGAFVINLLTAWMVSHGSENDLNLRSAFLHLLGDVFSTLGAILAGVGIWLTGMNWLDPLASIFIGALILWNAWLILRETVEILLESTPEDVEMSTMVRDLLQIQQVRGVHDLHVWSLSKRLRILSVHIVIDDMPISQAALIQREISEMTGHQYGIAHCTVQVECESCHPDSLYCDIKKNNHRLHHHSH